MEFRKLPYVVTLWSSSAYLAPAVGPLIGGYAVEAKNWHWSLLELLWLCSPLWVFLFFFLPETSSDNILLRRAARLRKLTGNPNYKSQSEIKQANMSAKTITFNALVKPWQLNALDPAILFSTVYVSLAYSIFYTFFEAFPLVFPVMHGFGLGETGLAFIAVPIGLMIAIPAQLLHYYFVAEPFLIKNGQPAPEYWLRPALIGNIFGPIGLFIFGRLFSPSLLHAVLLMTLPQLGHPALQSTGPFPSLAWPYSKVVHTTYPTVCSHTSLESIQHMQLPSSPRTLQRGVFWPELLYCSRVPCIWL